MADEPSAPGGGQSEFEKVAEKNPSLLAEVWAFLGENKKWWLLPILVVFSAITVMVVLTSTAAAPFIYTFF
jgi:Family of unknown function (DUF5989)